MILAISEFSTPRKCSVCQEPAIFWNYKKDRFGGADKSSKSPRCEEHKETV